MGNIFKSFNIDNYESLFLKHGFLKLDDTHEYYCEYCESEHYADIFEKLGKRYYYNYELQSVVKIGFPD